MGTFHNNKGELHGISVVVDMLGPTIYVGRCDEVTDQQVVLLDAAEHQDGREGCSKKEFVRRTARFGIPKMQARIVLPRAEVASVRRLGEVAVD